MVQHFNPLHSSMVKISQQYKVYVGLSCFGVRKRQSCTGYATTYFMKTTSSATDSVKYKEKTSTKNQICNHLNSKLWEWVGGIFKADAKNFLQIL